MNLYEIKEDNTILLHSQATGLDIAQEIKIINDIVYFPVTITYFPTEIPKRYCLDIRGNIVGILNDREEVESYRNEQINADSFSIRRVKKLRSWIFSNKKVLEAFEQKKIDINTLTSLLVKEGRRASFWKKLKIKMILFNNEENGEKKVTAKTFKKLTIGAIVFVVLIVLAFASLTVISPTQRGVKVTLGKAGDTVIQPGLVMKTPFIQSVKKYDLSPKQLEMKFSMGQDAAVTSDMQSVACEMVVYWTYDESKILDIVNGYSDSTIKSLVKDNTLGAVKEVIGKYSIYDIVEKQEEVTEKVKAALVARLDKYPVTISNATINNWDWSQEFDAQIANTMKMAQQVKVAQQELEVTKQQAQKQVAEANAAKEKAEIEAKMRVTVAEQEALAREKQAQGQANAAKVTADAEAYKAKVAADAEAYAREVEGKAEAAYYANLAKQASTIESLRKLDIEATRAQNWNGVEVSTYLPLAANGTLVTLK